MKPNELRIGNWVSVYDSYYRLHEDEMEILMGARNYDDYYGIPLTPEILEKAGFFLLAKNNCFYCKKIAIGREVIEISVCHKDGIVFYDGKYQEKLPLTYKYLHQLQNFYFALTGEELIISL